MDRMSPVGESRPLISIVTPSFNQARFLEATIRSVLTQNYPNLEYIIMDGGSTDGSVGIIKRHADRLTHWESGPDGGQAAAIAKGFTRSRGDILGWLNSDDILMPGALAKIADAFLAAPEACAITGRCIVIDAAGKPVSVSAPVIRSWRSMLCAGTGMAQMATFWRKSAYDAVGRLDTQMYFSFDFDLFVRLRKYGDFRVVPDYLAGYRIHEATKTSRSLAVMWAEDRMIMRRYAGVGGLAVPLSQMAKIMRHLRPFRRIQGVYSWQRDRTAVLELCAAANLS